VAVAALAARILAAALLESDDLRSALVVQHFGCNRGARHRGRAQHRRVAAHHQNFAKPHDRADVAGDLAYLEYIIRNHTELPAAGFDDCEHRLIPSCSIPSSSIRPGRLLVQSVMGTCSARWEGPWPYLRKNKRRRKSPRRMAGFIAGQALESRQTGSKNRQI